MWHPLGDLDSSIRAMTSRIRHRGPDADGHEIFPGDGLALGHRRLSIVDLSPTGAQPMTSGSGRFCVVFNGEIYNHVTLRSELHSDGQVFRGSSDTEVMLSLFDRHGVEATIPRLAGMFAIAVWDLQERVLWLVRDRMGEKPLYYGQFGDTFAFGSELKALRCLSNCPTTIDPMAICDVLERGVIRGTRSILSGVVKLPPGSLLRVARNETAVHTQLSRYWTVQQVLDRTEKDSRSAQSTNREAIDALDALLCQVVGEEAKADVPVGAFLSGGIDSSLIVAVMQQVSALPVRTFTIGFDEAKFDESAAAAVVAKHLGTTHTTIPLRGADALQYVDRLPDIFDEPFADSSQLPTLLVCQATQQHVTVALSGDGGDELFGGYSQYTSRDSLGHLAAQVPRPLQPLLGAVASFAPEVAMKPLRGEGSWSPHIKARLAAVLRSSSDPRVTYETLVSEWADPASVLSERQLSRRDLLSRLAQAWPRAATFPEQQMAYDMQTYLPDDILVKVDRSAMSVSLETRAPLLDHRVVEFALAQPLENKIADGKGKLLLRQLLGRYVPSALWDRPKQGFGIPLAQWLRTNLRAWSTDILRDDQLLREWLEPTMVKRILREHQDGVDHSARLWRLLMIMQWIRGDRQGL